MRCPTLKELPPPPDGKSGWPWTEESLQFPNVMPDSSPWLRISIVTPSYNQGQFLEETIRSVLLQGYTDLEYIIIDGGSADNSIDIIHKYEPWLAYWESEKDRGQAHAINKGFNQATGDVFAWINSDDYYYPNIFHTIARIFVRYPKVMLLHGNETYVNMDGCLIKEVFPALKNAHALTFYYAWPLLQLTCFWRRRSHFDIGGLDETLYCYLDYDFFLRMAYRFPSKYIPLCVGAFRQHSTQKTDNVELYASERVIVYNRFLSHVGISVWKHRVCRCWYRLLGLRNTQGFNGIIRSLLRNVRELYHGK